MVTKRRTKKAVCKSVGPGRWSKADWTPVRRGSSYCSPACGDGCTYAAFKAVTAESKKLAKQAGPGWTSAVHENLGWHSQIHSPDGRVKVYWIDEDGRRTFRALLGSTWSGSGPSISAAVNDAVTRASQAITEMAREGGFDLKLLHAGYRIGGQSTANIGSSLCGVIGLES